MISTNKSLKAPKAWISARGVNKVLVQMRNDIKIDKSKIKLNKYIASQE